MMARIAPAPPEKYEPLFGSNAPLHMRVYAHRPAMAAAFAAFSSCVMADARELPDRLMELVRLRVAFHNQCRSCMANRYLPEDEVPEGLVCSLERPEEADDLSARERIAIEYADRMATNHLSVDDKFFDRLRGYFSEDEIVELGYNVALWVGFGRLTATWHMVDDLPERFAAEGRITPWGEGAVVRSADRSPSGERAIA
jgi:alkylhydroperoxidase family enzyme